MLGIGDARPRSTQHAAADTAARRSAERCSKLFAFARSESMQAAACSMCRERARNCERASACAFRELDVHNSFDKQVAIIHPEPERTTLILTSHESQYSVLFRTPRSTGMCRLILSGDWREFRQFCMILDTVSGRVLSS